MTEHAQVGVTPGKSGNTEGHGWYSRSGAVGGDILRHEAGRLGQLHMPVFPKGR